MHLKMRLCSGASGKIMELRAFAFRVGAEAAVACPNCGLGFGVSGLGFRI